MDLKGLFKAVFRHFWNEECNEVLNSFVSDSLEA